MADQYAREAARVSALQLAYHAGFDVAQESCVEILADLLLRYVNEVGAGSHHYAELAGRSETNAVDVALALNGMGTSIEQLRDFKQHSKEVPFEANISAFPQRKKPRAAPTFADRGEAPPPHIPAWLPALPDRHTYVATPVYPGHEKDPQKRQMQVTEQRQQGETAVVQLQARLAGDSNQLLAAKLQPEGADGDGAAAAAEAEAAEAEAAPGQQQEAEQQHAAAAAAAVNPFFAAPWSDAQQQRKARIATSGRPVREAFGEAYAEEAAAKAGKRQKRPQRPDAAAVAAAVAAANDPTRARVEGILQASAQPVVAGVGAPVQEDLMQEEI